MSLKSPAGGGWREHAPGIERNLIGISDWDSWGFKRF